MRIDRMMAITVMLLNRDRIQARELAEKFEVSVRTIYRDIEAINMAGIPIVSFSGQNGGFGIMPNYKLNSQLLSFEDMLSILGALKSVGSAFAEDEVDGAIQKIRSLVPAYREQELEDYYQRVIFEIHPWGSSRRAKKVLKDVHQAVIKGELVELDYLNTNLERLTRTVEPMTLYFKGHAWYVYGWCRLRESFRLFKLSRIKSLIRLSRSFDRREGSVGGDVEVPDSNRKDLELKLRFAPSCRIRVEEYFEDEQISIDSEGYMHVELAFPEDTWLYSFLLGFGEGLEVLSPPHVRLRLAEKLQLMLDNYR